MSDGNGHLVQLTGKDFKSDQEVRWCPGCGDYAILNVIQGFMVKAGQYQGKQYGIPNDWGFDQILYRTDKVKPKANSYSLLFDERYKGKIAWFDDIEMPEIVGLLHGYKDTWNQTDAQLKRTKDFLIEKKKLVRLIWSSETNMSRSPSSVRRSPTRRRSSLERTRSRRPPRSSRST